MRQIKIKDAFGHELNTEIYDNVKDPKGVVQIVHGLNEHARRYQEFCEFLNKEGYIAVAYDQFSQGYSRTDDEEYVNFTKKGVSYLIDGLNSVREYIKKEYKDLPIFVFGHSMGTMIIRYYLQTHENEYKKVCLNGGGYSGIRGINIGLLLGGFISFFRGNKPSKFFDNIFRQTQFKIVEKVEIDHFIEWLTSDPEKTELNMKDPFLYIRLTANSFMVNLKMIKYINTLKNIEMTSLDCPILLMSGSHDPATDFGAGVIELHDFYKELGLQSQYKIYDEGRHDTLQEVFRQDVFKDISSFFGGK